MHKYYPLIFIVIIALVAGLEPFMPVVLKSALVAMSLTLKSSLMFVLPLLIFCLIFKATVQLYHQASKMIVGIVLMICCSNFLATWVSHYIGLAVSTMDLTLPFPDTGNALEPLWSIRLKPWVKNEHALLAGFLSGFLLSYWRPLWAEKWDETFNMCIQSMLKSMLMVMPIFIMGFVVKLQADGALKHILKDYALIFVIIGFSQYAYIALMYALASQGWQNTKNAIKNMLPAAFVGFSTMSSAAAIPLTLTGVSKQAKDPELARAIVPATVNNHLMGDCFAIPILAFAILKTFGIALPTTTACLMFTGYFVLAKFSVAAIPGGGIIVMLPVLEKYLGFEPMMLSLITALYILFDPIITSANVMGNGGFAMLMDKFAARLRSRAEVLG